MAPILADRPALGKIGGFSAVNDGRLRMAAPPAGRTVAGVGRYLARKSGFYLVTFVVAVTVDWAIPRFMPGDPIQGLLSRMQAQPGSQEALTGFGKA